MLSKYRMLARLGSGGMAEVYLVLAEGPGGFTKLQVLKLMRSDLTDQERPDFLQMFQDEARLAARLNHPNIVQSHEVGAEDGQPFIVMEFLEGQSLSRVQQRTRYLGRGFSLDMELFVLCQVLEGLDYAHRLTDYDGTPLNIVHRDVSPQNVFITYTGQTKLLDFGVAKTLESSKTRAGVVKGKVAYMAPEQIRSAPVDRRADVFSVGVLLWETIAGQPMHAELSVFDALNRLVKGDLPKLRDVAPEAPRELERIVGRALALDPNERYADADAFRHDLHTYLDSVSKVRARDVGACVSELFERERSEISQVIRDAMAESTGRSTRPPGEFRLTRMVPLVGAPRASSMAAPAPVEPEPTMLQSLGSNPTLLQRARGSGIAHKGWVSALSVAVVIGASALVAFMSKSSGARSGSPAGDSAELTTRAEHAQPPPVELEIQVEPKEAAILLDGRVLGMNPYRGREPRDQREHTVTISAPGYQPLEQLVRLDQDLKLQLQLEPAAPTAAKPGGKERTTTHPIRVQRRPRIEPPRAHELTNEAKVAEPYLDLPAPTRRKRSAPELDKSDPWEPEAAR